MQVSVAAALPEMEPNTAQASRPHHPPHHPQHLAEDLDVFYEAGGVGGVGGDESQAFVLLGAIAVGRLDSSGHQLSPSLSRNAPPASGRGHFPLPAQGPAQDESACGFPVPFGFGETRLEVQSSEGSPSRKRAPARQVSPLSESATPV